MRNNIKYLKKYANEKGYNIRFNLYDFDWLKSIWVMDKNNKALAFDTPSMGFKMGSRNDSEYIQPKIDDIDLSVMCKNIDQAIEALNA